MNNKSYAILVGKLNWILLEFNYNWSWFNFYKFVHFVWFFSNCFFFQWNFKYFVNSQTEIEKKYEYFMWIKCEMVIWERKEFIMNASLEAEKKWFRSTVCFTVDEFSPNMKHIQISFQYRKSDRYSDLASFRLFLNSVFSYRLFCNNLLSNI